MKRFLLFSFTSVAAYVLLSGCSSSGGGGAAASCGDAGPCPNGYECQGDTCVLSATGGTGQGGSGQGGSGNVGTGGVPSGGTGGVGGGTGGSSNCGDLALTDPACQSCMDSYCCTEMAACDSTSQCYGLLGCIQQNCATATDVGACAEQYCSAYADGVTAYNAVNMCLENNCLSACGG